MFQVFNLQAVHPNLNAMFQKKSMHHKRLRDVLGNIKGRFLLSYDDSPKVRELYKGYEMIEVERQNGINNREGSNRENKIYKELWIANYPIKELFKNV